MTVTRIIQKMTTVQKRFRRSSTQRGSGKAAGGAEAGNCGLVRPAPTHVARTLLFTSTSSSSVHVRYENSASRSEILPDEYRKLLRSLNAKQKQMVMFHRSWCKKAAIALK